ncbi:MAG: hypothetical protein KAH01_03090 [Caldisericia bacterium]|nr:hypothetical protein [Caldisericia bacterium]
MLVVLLVISVSSFSLPVFSFNTAISDPQEAIGNSMFAFEDTNSNIADITVSENQSTKFGASVITEIKTEKPNSWWDNTFSKRSFGGWLGSYFVHVKDSLKDQISSLNEKIQKKDWANFKNQDIKDYSLLVYVFLLCLLLLLLLLAALIGRKWKLLLLIPILIIISIAVYTIAQFNLQRLL